MARNKEELPYYSSHKFVEKSRGLSLDDYICIICGIEIYGTPDVFNVKYDYDYRHGYAINCDEKIMKDALE